MPILSTQSLNLPYTMSTSIFKIKDQYPEFLLNEFQTQNYDKILSYSDFNYIFRSPTGSGKTYLQDLAISCFAKEQYIILVILPNKSLLIDRYEKHLKYFHSIKSDILSSDSNCIQSSSQVIYCNIEKAVEYLKRDCFKHIQQKIQLIIIDEIHYIKTTKDYLYWYVIQYCIDKSIRFLGFSATIEQNVVNERYAIFTEYGIRKNIKYSFCQFTQKNLLSLSKIHIGIAFKQLKDNVNFILDTILQKYKGYLEYKNDFIVANKQILIFCPSQKIAEHVSLFFSQKMQQVQSTNFQSESLQQVVSCQVGFHHASLPESDKGKLLQLFIDKKIQILSCTSTLIVGVNISPDLVVIYSSISVNDNQFVRLNTSQIEQMAGRSGRQLGLPSYCCFIDDIYLNDIKATVQNNLFFKNKLDDQLIPQDESIRMHIVDLFSSVLGQQLSVKFIQQRINESVWFISTNYDTEKVYDQFQQLLQYFIQKYDSNIIISQNLDYLFQYHISIQLYNSLTKYLYQNINFEQISILLLDELNFFNSIITKQQINKNSNLSDIYSIFQQNSQTIQVEQSKNVLNRLIGCALQIYNCYEDIIKLVKIKAFISSGNEQNNVKFNISGNQLYLTNYQLLINAQFYAIILVNNGKVIYGIIDINKFSNVSDVISVQNKQYVKIQDISKIFIQNLQNLHNEFSYETQINNKEIQHDFGIDVEPVQKNIFLQELQQLIQKYQ
eukprot:EST47358.1 Helicase [Spironucleus salmonicida]